MIKYETNSFIQFWIVNSDPRLYHNQLRHFAQARSLIDDVEPLEHQINEFRAFEREAAKDLLEGQDEVLGDDEDDLTQSDDPGNPSR